MALSDNHLLKQEFNGTLARFYHWIEKQKNAGTTLTTAYLNRQSTHAHPISEHIKRIDFFENHELS